MFFFWLVSLIALATDETEPWMVWGGLLFLAVGCLCLFMALTPMPVIEIDDEGIRAPLNGWEVRWDEVQRVWLHTIWIRAVRLRMLVVAVDDPAAVADRHRRSHRWGPGRRARVVKALSRNGVRFPLSNLDTPRSEVIAAVERHVPVER